jgi:hypothetical protein
MSPTRTGAMPCRDRRVTVAARRTSRYGSEPALKGSVPRASDTPLSELLAFM